MHGMQNMGLIALTTGEPAGIGGEITLSALSRLTARQGGQGFSLAQFCVLADVDWWRTLAQQLALDWPIKVVHSLEELQIELQRQRKTNSDALWLWHHPLAAPVVAGQLDARNGPYVLSQLSSATQGAMAKVFAAVVTAPLQKSVLMHKDPDFMGHTEYFAKASHTDTVVMMLAAGEFRVALATTHIPLSQVPAAITRPQLSQTLQVLHNALQQQMGIAQPRILVTGLNPHAGEGGHLGREEIEVITPVLEAARARGWLVQGPLPADTAFQKKYLKEADCFLAMYHDQGLSVLKFAGFGESVNITLGLPFIRTSVDHGTALDLAGKNQADASSMVAAIMQALKMVQASGNLLHPTI